MNCAPKNRARSCAPRWPHARTEGFTLAEVLAALVFLAVVIPVAVEGLRVASRAGVVSQRKAVAARIADRMLNDWIIAGASSAGSPRGTVEEDGTPYQWSLRSELWTEAAMRLVTVEVLYDVQGQEFDLRLATLVGPR